MKRFFVLTLLVMCSLATVANANQIEEQVSVSASVEEPKCLNPVAYSIQCKPAPNNKGHIVYVDSKQTVWFVKDSEGITSQERAQIVADKIEKILKAGISPEAIKPVREGQYTYIQAGEEKIVTVDEANAKAVGVSIHELAYTWANNTRIALGAKELRKDYSDLSRGFNSQESRYLGHTMTGMASWYGAPFHGRRSSDGSRYNKNEFTAAHLTYPFGTLVKVTNLRNNKSCVVKITDRGPYAHGRIIDLSQKAAEELGMLSSGVVKVKLEVVGSY